MTNRADALTDEVWRPIPGSEGLYSVSDRGRVRSEPIQTSNVGERRGRILSPCVAQAGYLQFCMALRESRRPMRVHIAVGLAFLGDRPKHLQTNHKNGDKLDNRVENLEYVTCLENTQHAHATGLCANRAHGEGSNLAKLTVEDVKKIRALAGTQSPAAIGRRFGISRQNATVIIKRKTWRHVA